MSSPVSKQILKTRHHQRGQMAIFIALIFQILFVFFAMAINLGLVVYDKINLQNATDLAAFYAAQRQAELLNVIAHTNYQIHQSWKLLNWRYYVVGSLGREGTKGNPMNAHPSRGLPRKEEPWPGIPISPAVCVMYSSNWPEGKMDNTCKTENFTIQNISVPKTIASFLPWNIMFEGLARTIQQKVADSCNSYAAYNWFYATNTYVSYIVDQASRKELIRALARNLARKPEEIVDLNGDSIYEGARKTFIRNLTASNAESAPEFEMLNPLEGLAPNAWLPEIDVWFTMFYQDLYGNTQTCSSNARQIDQRPADDTSWNKLKKDLGNEELLNALLQYAQQAAHVQVGDPRRISLGVEKNPWYLAYIGVKGKSHPRPLFFPFGKGIQFEARAYAQPFGGRIGPWYGTYWAREADSSGGDMLYLSPDKLRAGGMMNASNPTVIRKYVPQYSRYPGDLLGMKSLLAQQSLKNLNGLRTHIADYRDIASDFGPGKVNDVVAFDPKPGSNIRQFEVSALAPDLFDITYYSIQPNFGERYLDKLRAASDALGVPERGYPRGDLGSREPDLKTFSVRDQILVANGSAPAKQSANALGTAATGVELHEPDAFWYVRSPEHLLTGWVHSDTYGQYSAFPEARFGKCGESDEKIKYDAPGGCMDMGGRTGYSVKIISPDIFAAELPLGGGKDGVGRIKNPPPEKW